MVAGQGTELKSEIVASVHKLAEWVGSAAQAGASADQVERHVFRSVLELGRQVLQGFFQMVGAGDLGETFTLPDGRTLVRFAELHERRFVSVFGSFGLSRAVYGTREEQAQEFVPVDQRLALPESEFSYLLQEWDQLLGVEHAYGKVVEVMQTILGLKQSVDSLERMNRQMAQAAEPFRASQPAPRPEEEGQILVATVDNKGIPMVRPADVPPPGAHRTKGEKANKKQMATLGCVYSVDPHVRTPEELVAILFRDPDRPQTQPPEACQRRYWAALTREVEGVLIHAQTEVYEQLTADILARRRDDQPLLHLTDGQRSLETDRQAHLPVDTIDVLDLLHILPRLWTAAHVFHPEGSAAAEAFVRDRLLKVLQGNARGVVTGLRRMSTTRGLRGPTRRRLAAACDFLENNLHRMKYDEYLAAGYPIATGVIEGACRHVIKDRMERAGMRWKVPGAQAMLHLRAITANHHWREFQDFRMAHETARLYPHTQALQAITWPLAV